MVFHFATTEDYDELDLVTVFQELESFLGLVGQIMHVGLRTDLNFFKFNDSLFLFGYGSLFLFFVLVLAVIHNFANGRIRFVCNLDKIEAERFGELNRLSRIENS